MNKAFTTNSAGVLSAASPDPTRRPTIAFFGGTPGGELGFEKWQMWRGIAEAAQEHDANILYVAGEEFEYHPEAVLYQIVNANDGRSAGRIDGLIFWDSFVSHRSSLESVQQFLSRYASIPIVGIEIALDGISHEMDISSVILDHRQGLTDLITHLTQQHNYQRIAYLTHHGVRSAVLRLEMFEQVMTSFGLFDPNLVLTLADFQASASTAAKACRPGIDFQAIVTNSDTEATRLVEILTQKGLRIPEDVAVTGFNDGREARGLIPPLTTLRLPFRLMGRQATGLLLHQITARANASPAYSTRQLTIPMRLVLRRSCGCLEPLAEQASIGPFQSTPQTLPELIRIQRQQIASEMERALSAASAGRTPAQDWITPILDSFFAEISQRSAPNHTPGAFLPLLNDLLRQAVQDGINVNRWHELFTIMRRSILPYLSLEDAKIAEDIWQQVRVLIGQTAARAEVHRSWQSVRDGALLREIESALLFTSNLEELTNNLVAGLPGLGIRGCYLSLYEKPAETVQGDGSARSARLLLAYQDGQRKASSTPIVTYPANEIVPESWLPAERRFSLLLEALNYRQEQIGFVAFEADPAELSPDSLAFNALKISLSSALKAVSLRQELQNAVREAQEANQLKSRFLSMVSHELRTPLNLIVGLSEMALREQSRPEQASLEVLRKFQEQIYVSGQHLDRLIRDVLDLASSQVGKMDLICSQVDLGSLLRDVAIMGRQIAQQKRLAFVLDISEALPGIWGDKTRLRQIVLNLLSNAVKFTAHGMITLRAYPSPEGVLISVSDTGLGIPADEQEKIFDEFQQSERTTARGYGGIGLGLAITRRLVEMHGGKIWVTSAGTEGEGSTFWFTLPAQAQQAVSLPGADASHGSAQNDSSTVLIITHEACSSELLLQHLEKQGFWVEELALQESPDYLSYLVMHPPGAVVLDLAPASEQGWEMIRVLKSHPAVRDIPVLFYSLVEEQNSGVVLEMETLSKPLTTEELVHALEKHGLRAARKDGQATILIIDDDPGILDLHSHMVEEALPGCCIVTAPDGRAGLALMREAQPDLVLLDLMMPEIDGFGFRKMLMDDPMLVDIPFVFLTANDSDNSIIEGFNLDIKDYIIKTTSPKVVALKIGNIIKSLKRERRNALKELQEAADTISMEVVPANAPKFPGFSLFQWNVPYQGVPGGDFIDYINIDENRMVVILGDIMGKKWGAWFFAFSFIGYIRSAIRVVIKNSSEVKASEILKKVNETIYSDAKISEIFSTVSVAIIDNNKNEVQYSGAGDHPMLRYDSLNKKVTQFVSEGLLLGLSNEGDYNDVIIPLNIDDILFIYTDGLIESRNKEGEQFGVPRIKDTILNSVSSSPEEELIKKFTDFTENKYEDDVSMIAIKKL